MTAPSGSDAVRFVYFDVDNTLLDHTHAERHALADTQSAFPDLLGGPSLDALQETYHRINAPLWTQYAAGAISKADVKHARFERLLNALDADASRSDAVNAHYLERYAAHWRFIPGARAAYESVAARYSVGLLTNGFVEIQRQKMTRFPVLTDHAEAVVVSETTGRLKPHPDVFAHAAAEARTAPEHILYVGDSYTSDVEGGQNAGWRVAWYTPNGATEPGVNGRSTDARGFAFQDWATLRERLL
jgi:YjjG family noncanonical pyrimidine nucleotidase